MPSPKSHRRGQEEKSRKGKLWAEKSPSFNGNSSATGAMQLPGELWAEKSSSFNGNSSATGAMQLRRPKTLPNLYSFRNPGETMFLEGRPKLTRFLLNVTIQGSVGPVQVLMPPELTVSDLVTAAVRQYLKEGRRPILPTTEPGGFHLHYSQFSLESLGREEKLVTLGSRNFFLCRNKQAQNGGGSETTTSSVSCSKEVEEARKPDGFSWLKFMEFSL